MTTTLEQLNETPALSGITFSKAKVGMLVETRAFPSRRGRIIAKVNAAKSYAIAAEDGGAVVAEHDEVRFLAPDVFDQVHPMLAKNVEDFKALDLQLLLADPTWLAEEKYDGERSVLTYRPVESNVLARTFRATTRVVGKHSGLLGDNTAKLPQLANIPLPTGGATIFDGELLHEQGANVKERFASLRSIMGSSDAEALLKQTQRGLVYVSLFDVLYFNGRDLRETPFGERRMVLEAWHREVTDLLAQPAYTAAYGMTAETFAWRVRLSPVATTEEEKRALLDRVLAEGGEGVMLKNKFGRYTDTTLTNQRSGDLLKVKPFTETETIITGFEMGQGMYNTEKYGAIKLAQWVDIAHVGPEMKGVRDPHPAIAAMMDANAPDYMLIDIGTAGGFTQEQEAAFRAAPDNFIGTVLDVKYQEGGRWPKTAKLRSPNFLALRPEKRAYDVLYTPAAA